jgi:hypothetical protein
MSANTPPDTATGAAGSWDGREDLFSLRHDLLPQPSFVFHKSYLFSASVRAGSPRGLNAWPNLPAWRAGLPKPELWIARLLFVTRRLTGNRDSFTARFQQERETFRSLLSSLDAESAARRVLIRRPRGLEDSSRYWSAWMTLDHLRIIHGSIIGIIGALTKGVAPPGEASTARVKPSPAVTATVVAEYEKSCDDLLSLVASSPDLNTKARYAHPWFGPLNAHGWLCLTAMHHGVHHRQLARVLLASRENKP